MERNACRGGLLRYGACGVRNLDDAIAEGDRGNLVAACSGVHDRSFGLLNRFVVGAFGASLSRVARNDAAVGALPRGVGQLNEAIAFGYGDGRVIDERRCTVAHLV